MRAIYIHVTGKVQGVFFRTSTKERADQLHLTGWVQNNEDGSVSIHAEGSEDALQKLIDWCSTGPSNAQVETVHTEQAAPQNHQTFEIAYAHSNRGS